MKKLILAGLVSAMMIAPFASQADDITDGAECRGGETGVTAHVLSAEEPNPDDVDRAALCVSDGSDAVLYIGGEAQAEEDGNPDVGGACGAIIIAGTNVTDSDENWNDPDSGDHCD